MVPAVAACQRRTRWERRPDTPTGRWCCREGEEERSSGRTRRRRRHRPRPRPHCQLQPALRCSVLAHLHAQVQVRRFHDWDSTRHCRRVGRVRRWLSVRARPRWPTATPARADQPCRLRSACPVLLLQRGRVVVLVWCVCLDGCVCCLFVCLLFGQTKRNETGEKTPPQGQTRGGTVPPFEKSFP